MQIFVFTFAAFAAARYPLLFLTVRQTLTKHAQRPLNKTI